MEKKLQDQVAIVTGASSGIGAGCAKELAKAGATVVVNYPVASTKDMAEQVVAEIAENGGKAIAYKCDVSREDEVKQMFADVVTHDFGTMELCFECEPHRSIFMCKRSHQGIFEKRRKW